MRSIRIFSILLALCLALALLPVGQVSAAESGSLWLRHIPSIDGALTMAVCADTEVASGVITITYDPSLLTFQGLTVESQYVLAHAVNDKDAGTIKIGWIGTGAGSEAVVLMRLQFTGDPLAVGTLSGDAQDASGKDVAITVLDFGALNLVMDQAAGLKAEDYTADSFAAVQAALDAANALGDVETVTQAQLAAAAAVLTKAMENLVVYQPAPPEPTDPTEPTEPAPTQPTPTQPAPTQPGSTPAQTQPSQTTPTPAPQPQKDDGMLIAVLAGCAVAVVVAVVLLKKRGKK